LGNPVIPMKNPCKDDIEMKWLLQEALTYKKLMGKARGELLNQIREIFGSDVNNFSYSYGFNILLSLPHIMNFLGRSEKKGFSEKLAKSIFE